MAWVDTSPCKKIEVVVACTDQVEAESGMPECTAFILEQSIADQIGKGHRMREEALSWAMKW